MIMLIATVKKLHRNPCFVFMQVDSGESLSRSEDGYHYIAQHFPQYDGTQKFLICSNKLNDGSGIYETLKRYEALFHRSCYKRVSLNYSY